MKLNIDQLSLEVASVEELDVNRKQAKAVVRQIFEAIAENLENGHEVAVPGFGKFRRKESGERQGRNPRTGESMVIKAKKSPAFVPAKELKERVNI